MVSAKQFEETGGTEDWRVLAAGASSWYDAPTHAAGAELLRGIVDAAGERRLDLDLRQNGIHVRIPFGPNGLTADDATLARAISGVARGLRSDPAARGSGSTGPISRARCATGSTSTSSGPTTEPTPNGRRSSPTAVTWSTTSRRG
ncbi:hypothetical protein JOD67_004532 [Tenggerimyces flavus]|nr:hypothetical protein [Tenggerimyces flavus]MBM7787852.1 hypothetical protein [Tenggerimyces flavus]